MAWFSKRQRNRIPPMKSDSVTPDPPRSTSATRSSEPELDHQRERLFAGYEKPKNDNSHTEPPAEGDDDDVEDIKQKIKGLKGESVTSTGNALRLAREAEETARGTLSRLGEQSEKLANTERHMDVAERHTITSADQIDELKKLNKSIFRPAITFNKDAKRAAQEAKIMQRYDDERCAREKTLRDVQDSQRRLGQGSKNSDGGLDSKDSRQGRPSGQDRKRFQFEAGTSDDELEQKLDDDLEEISDVTASLKALGIAMGQELEAQNSRLDNIAEKASGLDGAVFRQTERLKRIR